MGYRSDVTYVFYTRKQSVVPFPALKLWFEENYPHKVATEEWGAQIEAGTDWIMVSYESVKWYSDYSHTQNVNAAIVKFNETFEANDHDDVAWEMVEVGEDLNDTQRDHSAYCDWRLDVERKIHFM